MVNSWQPILTSIRIVDNVHNKTLYMDPHAFTANGRWSRHADMAKQYAQCIQRNLQKSASEARGSLEDLEISTENISIYFDIWCSMNSRFQQRVFDPRVDILTAEWSPFTDTPWVLPLLSQLTDKRPQLMATSEHVLSWSNHSDVLFIADYPGLSLDNYVTDSVDNVTLTVLNGRVRVSYDDVGDGVDKNPTTNQSQTSLHVTLSTGQSIPILRETFHHILVVSDEPASYMYTFTNTSAAMESGQGATSDGKNNNYEWVEEEEREENKTLLLMLWEETKERWNKFETFFQHVLNSLLHEIYGVPLPRKTIPESTSTASHSSRATSSSPASDGN